VFGKRILCDARRVVEVTGGVALLGGGEVGEPDLATWLLEHAGGGRVAVIPTARAFEHPEAEALRVAEWLGPAGAVVEALMATSRSDANDEGLAARLEDADLAYLSDGTALHLRTTLRGTALLAGLERLVERGGLLAASGAAATVLCDPMIDPRGGAPTVGLGLVRSFTLLSHLGGDPDDPKGEKLHRAAALCPPTLPLVALPLGSGLLLGPGGSVEAFGRGGIEVYLAGVPTEDGLDVLRSR
jgi:cyanophycinase